MGRCVRGLSDIENLDVLTAPLPKGDGISHLALDSRVDGRAPPPTFTRQALLQDRPVLKGACNPSTGFQPFNDSRTPFLNGLDSVELRVE